MTRPPRSLRDAATEVVRRLVEAGFEAYFAGGCVRDELMGLEPTDYDVATDARPDDVRGIFRRAHRVGESFGVMLVRMGGHQIEVATFRTDGVYSDGRRPDSVSFSDADHDARRRDFTINGLFEDPISGRVIDLVGGRADLDARVIRAIGDPEARIREDRLRMLRAVRFGARFGFRIEPRTERAIRAAAGQLTGVSRERIGQEVKRMIGDPTRHAAAVTIQRFGLDAPVLDEPAQDVPLPRLEALPDGAESPLALAAWLLDRHEGRDEHPVARGRRWAATLMLSNQEQSALVRALEANQVLRGPWDRLGVAARKRLAATGAFDAALALLAGVDPEAAAAVEADRDRLAATGLAPTPLIGGDDLITMGLRPGPAFSRILDRVYDAQLEGMVATRRDAIDLARRIAAESGPSGP